VTLHLHKIKRKYSDPHAEAKRIMTARLKQELMQENKQDQDNLPRRWWLDNH